MKIPKNIEAMTDAEHHAWLQSLSNDDHTKAGSKTYRLVEYVVSTVDAEGDIIETEAFSSLAQAEQAYNEAEAEAVVLERLTNHYSVLHRDLEDREYKTLTSRGDALALLNGGF